MLSVRRPKVTGAKGWRLLIESEEGQDGGRGALAENALNRQQEQSLQATARGTQGLEDHALLSNAALIAKNVEEKLPHPEDRPADLQRHLQALQDTVLEDLRTQRTRMEAEGMRSLLECYHRRVCEHLQGLLLLVDSTKNSIKDYFGLMRWALNNYLSQELLLHPDLQSLDPLRQVDLLLLAEWTVQAKSKMLQSVQTEVQGCLEKILQEETWRGCRASDNEEDFIGLSVDTIQCVEANPKQAQTISEELAKCVREVCFEELLVFVQKYAANQTALLRKQTQTNQPQMSQFLKTLKTCQELRQYVQTKGSTSSVSMVSIVVVLDNMEAVTTELLMTNITNIMEINLRMYFRSNSQRFCLTGAVKELFQDTSHCASVLKEVIDRVYTIITPLYLKHLIRHRRRKLERSWSPDVAQTMYEDAQLLQSTMQELAPGVQQWNMALLRVAELLRCEDTEAMKLVVGSMSEECRDNKEDLDLLPSILKWKGLSKREAQKVLAVCCDAEPPDPHPWGSRLLCCLMPSLSD